MKGKTNTRESDSITVSDEIIAICAVNATLKTHGVLRMAGGFSNALSKNLLGKDLLSKGVKVSQDDDGIEMDVHVIVEYGHKIPAVAWDIQENVKKEISTMIGKQVKTVNIHVQGVETDDSK